jgi:hypothetical protein
MIRLVPASLGSRLTQWHSESEVHVAHVEPDDLAEAETGAQGDGEDRVIARVADGGVQERLLFGLCERRWAKVSAQQRVRSACRLEGADRGKCLSAP